MKKQKITFDLEKIREFIDYVEVNHYGRCGETYTEEFRITDDGIIQHRYYSFSSRLNLSREWNDYEDGGIIKGVITVK